MAQFDVETNKKAFKCLVADDSEFARKNISRIVSMIGGDVVGEAKNGFEAIDLYFKLKPDIVLLDITMPQLDGMDTLRKIIEGDKNAAVIIVSSIGHKEMVWKAICLGARHYVTKPYNPVYVTMIIKSVLETQGEGLPGTTINNPHPVKGEVG